MSGWVILARPQGATAKSKTILTTAAAAIVLLLLLLLLLLRLPLVVVVVVVVVVIPLSMGEMRIISECSPWITREGTAALVTPANGSSRVHRSATNRQLVTLASSSTRRFDRKMTSRFVLSYVVMPRERRRRT